MPRIILIIIGWLAVALGTLGVFLPLLPTTPFILLAAWCFARSSPRFHHWLLYRPWFGGYLRHWQKYRAMPPGAKPRAVAMILLTFAISLWLVNLTWVRILLLIILTSPIMLVTAIIIKCYDGGPVLYKQVRCTIYQKEFKIMKFRSMRVDAEKDGVARLASRNDSRITPIGKFIRSCRIDELPQLFNILCGDMSFIGPRPERPEITAGEFLEQRLRQIGLAS